jgi:hypothetical protein
MSVDERWIGLQFGEYGLGMDSMESIDVDA